MVAKSAAVRHIAQGPHSAHFVLKGGTLLTHVYSSPRPIDIYVIAGRL
jgi:hypothetical protein